MIRKKALKAPEDTQGIIDLVAYMEKVKSLELILLADEIKSSRPQLLFLLGVGHEFTPDEMELTTTTNGWPEKILDSIDGSDIMMEKSKHWGEDTLTAKREDLMHDIVKLRSRIKGFEEFADMSQMQCYGKEVTSVKRALANLLT